MSGHVRAFDGIRGIAVLAVLLFHAEALSPGTQRFVGGFIGVSVFFTLSGFLLAGQALREHERDGRVSLAPFASRRIARLAPTALAAIAAVLLISRTQLATWSVPNGFAANDAVAALWQVTNWHLAWLPDSAGFRLVHPLTHFWSLAVEVQLYVLFAIVVAAAGSRPLRPHLRRLATAGWITSLALALVLHSTVRREEFGTDVRLAEFAAGVLLAVAVPRVSGGRITPVIRVVGALAPLVFVAVVLFVERDEFWLSNGGYALLSLVWAGWIAAALQPGRLQRVCSWTPLVRLGAISYSLYVVHWPIVLLLPDERVHLTGWPAVTLRIALALCASAVVYRYLEQPARVRLAGGRPSRLLPAWLTATVAVSLSAIVLL